MLWVEKADGAHGAGDLFMGLQVRQIIQILAHRIEPLGLDRIGADKAVIEVTQLALLARHLLLRFLAEIPDDARAAVAR